MTDPPDAPVHFMRQGVIPCGAEMGYRTKDRSSVTCSKCRNTMEFCASIVPVKKPDLENSDEGS